MARNLVGKFEWTDTWYSPNREKAKSLIESLPPSWAEAKGDSGMTSELMRVMGERDGNGAFGLIVEQMARGKIRAGAIWDAVHLAAAEAYIRGDTNNALHSNTGVNALHYAFRTCGDDDVRLRILMRAVSWLCEPISSYPTRAKNPLKITEISPLDIPAAPEVAAEEVVASPPAKPWNDKPWYDAVGKALAFAQQHPESKALWQLQRRQVFAKAGDAHDYKFLAAIWENSQQVSAQFRPCLVAASVGKIRLHAGQPDSATMLQVREALR
jgi:hypothetical protein